MRRVQEGGLYSVRLSLNRSSTSVLQDNPAIVTVHDESRHGLEDGDQVIFDEVEGMTELNSAKPVKVTVTGTPQPS